MFKSACRTRLSGFIPRVDLTGFRVPLWKVNMCLVDQLPLQAQALPSLGPKSWQRHHNVAWHAVAYSGALPLDSSNSAEDLHPAPQLTFPSCHLYHVPRWLSCDSLSWSPGLNSWLIVTFCSLVTSEAMTVDLWRSSICTDLHSPVKNKVTGIFYNLVVFFMPLIKKKYTINLAFYVNLFIFIIILCMCVYVFVCVHTYARIALVWIQKVACDHWFSPCIR